MSAQRKDLRTLSVAFAICALGSWLSAFYLEEHYYEIAPHVPIRSTGHIYAINYHGIGLFLTRAELDRLHLMMIASAVLFGMAVLLEIFRKRNLPRKPAWLPNAKWDEPDAPNQEISDERRRQIRK